MTRDVVVRAVVFALALMGVAAFVIDWDQLVLPGGLYRTLDASVEGDPTLLKAKVSGYLAAVPVMDFSAVHAGALLFAIDDRDYRARVDEARAGVAQAEAMVGVTEAMIAQQGAAIDAARANVAGADAEVARARAEKARQAGLLHTESYLARDWQGAVAADQGALAGAAGSRRALTAQVVQTDVLRAQLAANQASLASARAQLTTALVELGYTRVVAPFDAVATARLARTGEYVAAGTALITLVPAREKWVVANFRERQLARMRPGMAARVTVDAVPGVVFAGHVESIEPVSQAQGAAMPPDRAVGNFTFIVQRVPVKIVLDAAPHYARRLLPGLSAEAEVDTSGENRFAGSAAGFGGPQ